MIRLTWQVIERSVGSSGAALGPVLGVTLAVAHGGPFLGDVRTPAAAEKETT